MGSSNSHKNREQGQPITVLGQVVAGMDYGAIYTVPAGRYLTITKLLTQYRSIGSNTEMDLIIRNTVGTRLVQIREVPAASFGAGTPTMDEQLENTILLSEYSIGYIGDSTLSNNGQMNVAFSGVLT